MNRNQENSGEGRNTLPLKENRPLNGLAEASLANVSVQGFDSLQATQQAAACGQHPTGGAVPIVAPAARVSPVVREVQL